MEKRVSNKNTVSRDCYLYLLTGIVSYGAYNVDFKQGAIRKWKELIDEVFKLGLTPSVVDTLKSFYKREPQYLVEANTSNFEQLVKKVKTQLMKMVLSVLEKKGSKEYKILLAIRTLSDMYDIVDDGSKDSQEYVHHIQILLGQDDRYLLHRNSEIQLQTCKTLAHVLSQTMKLNHDYQRNNVLNSGLSEKFAYPLSRMLKTALNDGSEDRKLELSILQLFNQNPIFDEYLATNENFEKLLYIYNDDNLKVKIEVVKTIGRMGYANHARAIPELRKMLVDIKNKLEHSGNSKDKCDVAKLISSLACEVPDILKTNLPVPLPDIMNILYQNLVEQYDKETSLNNEIENIDNLEAEVENDENVVGRKNSFNRKRAISRTQGELESSGNLTSKGRTTSKGRIDRSGEFERKSEDDVFEDEDNEIHEIIKMSTKAILVQTIYLQCLSDLIDLAPVEIELYKRFVELFLGKPKHGNKDNKDGYLRADASHATNKEDSKRRVYTLKCLCKLHQSPITMVPRGYGQKRQFTAYFVGLRTYVEYPHFQERIFDLLRQTMFMNEVPEVRVLAVKTLGILGALDPDQYRRIQYATKQKLEIDNKAAILAGTDLGQSSIDPADETEADMTRFYGQPSTHMLVDEGMNNLAGKNHNKMDLALMGVGQSEENEVPRPPPIEIRDLKSCIHILSRDLEDKPIDYQITILETITKLIEQASGFGGSQTKQSNRPFKNYKDMVQDQVKIVIPKMLEIIPQIAKKDFTKVHDVMVNIRKICEYLNKFIQDYVEDILKTVDQLWTAVYNYQQNSNFGIHYSNLHRNRRENNSLIFGTNIDRSLVLKEQYKLIIELINISAVVAKVRDVHFRQHIKVIITHMQRAFKGGELESNVVFQDLEHDEWQGFQKLMKEGKLVINNKERSQNWRDTNRACSSFGVIITILMRTREIFGKCVREFIRMILEAILDLIAIDCQQIREQALRTLRELVVRENLQKYMKPVSNSLVKLNVRQVKLKKRVEFESGKFKTTIPRGSRNSKMFEVIESLRRTREGSLRRTSLFCKTGRHMLPRL
jgi:hypothetical protein